MNQTFSPLGTAFFVVSLLDASIGSGTGWAGGDTGITARIGTDGHLAADDLRHAAGLGDDNCPRNAFRTCDVLRFADCARHTVGHLTGSTFLNHRAGGVRHHLCALLAGPVASGVRNLAGDALIHVAASGVRNLLGAALSNDVASGVRHLASTGFAAVGAGGVRNPLDRLAGNPVADRVRNAAMLDFGNHLGAADLLHDGLGAPDATANRLRWALNLNLLAATGLVFAAAGVRIEGELAGGLHALGHDWTGNALGDGLPFSTLDGNRLRGGDGPHHSLADIAIQSLVLGPESRAADVAEAGVVVGLTDRVADRLVAGVVDWSADGVLHCAVASVVDRFSDVAGDRPVTGLIVRPANRVGHGAVARFVDRTADRVVLGPVMGVVNDPLAGDRNLLVASVHYLHAFGVLFGAPDRVTHDPIPGITVGASGTVVPARCTTISWATTEFSSPEQAGVGCSRGSHRNDGDDRGNPRIVSHGFESSFINPRQLASS